MSDLSKFFRSWRLRFVMWVARCLRVPIDVHGSYFRKNLSRPVTHD
jgi:hypothetical protein